MPPQFLFFNLPQLTKVRHKQRPSSDCYSYRSGFVEKSRDDVRGGGLGTYVATTVSARVSTDTRTGHAILCIADVEHVRSSS